MVEYGARRIPVRTGDKRDHRRHSQGSYQLVKPLQYSFTTRVALRGNPDQNGVARRVVLAGKLLKSYFGRELLEQQGKEAAPVVDEQTIQHLHTSTAT
jgi:hypothetical protein